MFSALSHTKETRDRRPRAFNFLWRRSKTMSQARRSSRWSKGASASRATAGDLLVRADGYWICIDSKTKLKLARPLQTLADLKAGDWVDYSGVKGTDGEVTVASAKFGPNIPGKSEEGLRAKAEFDPSAVPADVRQNYWRMHALGRGLDPEIFRPRMIPRCRRA